MTTIELPSNTGDAPRIPVLKRRTIGETFVGMLIDTPDQRDKLKDDKTVLKPNGRPRQELVVPLIALPGTTMMAGLGDDIGVPTAGDVVRAILKGKAFSEWIDAIKGLSPHHVGDVIQMITTHAQAYDSDGRPMGQEIRTQAEADAVPRGRTLGFYGSITVRRSTPDEAGWVAKAAEAYHARNQITVGGGVDPSELDALTNG